VQIIPINAVKLFAALIKLPTKPVHLTYFLLSLSALFITYFLLLTFITFKFQLPSIPLNAVVKQHTIFYLLPMNWAALLYTTFLWFYH